MDCLLLPKVKKQPIKIIKPKKEPIVPIIDRLEVTATNDKTDEIFLIKVLINRVEVDALLPS